MQDIIWIKKTLIFLAVCISISASLQIFQEKFIYWRFSLFSEIWRWWTGHWVHVGWIHFILNMLAFICLPFIFPMIRKRFLVFLLFVLPLFISICFYVFFPDVQAYAGLSGVLHGLYMACALVCLQFRKERKFSILVIVLVSGKIVWENIFGSLQTASLIGSSVLIEAHLMGMCVGMLISGVLLLLQKVNPQQFKKLMFIELNQKL